MRGLFIMLILFFPAERSIANQLAGEFPDVISNFKKISRDTLPQQDKTPFHRCNPIEQPAEVNLMEWISYLETSQVLDSISLDTIPEGCYQGIVQFVIDKEGKIIDVKIQKDPGYGLGERMVNVISQYKGRWQPAKRNGRLVKSFHRQPITFIVEKEGEELLSSELIF